MAEKAAFEGIAGPEPWSIAAVSEQPMAHTPVPSREMSTTEGSPVRSRRKSAAAMPPAMVMPPIESP